MSEDSALIAGLDRGEQRGAWRTLVRGLRQVPQVRRGLALTLLLGVGATAGRLVAPVAVQHVVDEGLLAPEGPTLANVGWPLAGAALAVLAAGLCGFGMFRRLITVSERALYDLRVRAFRRLHDLSILHQAEEQRGSLVSRVTGDVDRISRFLQAGGVVLLINGGQLVLALLVMAWYSVTLTLIVLAVFVPLVFLLRWGLPYVIAAHRDERRAMGALMARISESVGGADVVRAYGIEDRTDARVSEAVQHHYEAGFRAGKRASLLFSTGESFAAAASGAVVVVGVLMGVGGAITIGELLAFLFLVSLFVAPVQVATEVLGEAQKAIAGWDRVLNLLEAEPDVVDPAAGDPDPAPTLPEGGLELAVEDVGFTYPDGTRALDAVTVTLPPGRQVAVVGETGSGKTTFAKLACRLMDPTDGRVLLGGVDLRHIPFAELRHRVAMVPQEGFLFDDTVAGNIQRGHRDATEADVRHAVEALALEDWVDGLPEGLDTLVGERGSALSAGERQIIALARAFVADPDVLVLDEATSSVDPGTEARLQEAMTRLFRGRSVMIIAHRLSTAQAADEVWVFDQARLVQQGPHEVLAQQPGRYRELVDSWRGVRVTAGG